jgi:hypothetical protein
MPDILDLGMSDEEYLQLVAQGRNPVQEYLCARNLIRAGIPAVEADRVARLLKKQDCSPEEEAIVQKAWQQVRNQ